MMEIKLSICYLSETKSTPTLPSILLFHFYFPAKLFIILDMFVIDRLRIPRKERIT